VSGVRHGEYGVLLGFLLTATHASVGVHHSEWGTFPNQSKRGMRVHVNTVLQFRGLCCAAPPVQAGGGTQLSGCIVLMVFDGKGLGC
jgi:hypothetical protein